MAIRLIAADLDDTLLDGSSALSERTILAVKRAMDAGVYFSLASGRMPQAMRRFADALGVNAPVIAYNGALIADAYTGEAIIEKAVPESLAREAAALAEACGEHIQAFARGEYVFERANKYSELYARSIGFEGRALGAPLSGAFTGGANKLLLISEPERVPALLAKFKNTLDGRLNCAVSRPNYIEIFHIDADKGAAISELANMLGVSCAETAAFGDGENDLPMLDWAGYGYVMANARPPILARAKLIAPSNAEDGVAQIIERLLEG